MIAAFIYPQGTDDDKNFQKEVEQIHSALQIEITYFKCDQSKSDILKNTESIIGLRPYYIILGSSMPVETISNYSTRFYDHSLFVCPNLRRERGPWIVHYSSNEFIMPELGLDDCVDGYYREPEDLILDLKDAPHIWLGRIEEPNYNASPLYKVPKKKPK